MRRCSGGEVRLRGRPGVRCAAGGQRACETTTDGEAHRRPAQERCHATLASALATGRTAGSDDPLMCIVGAASRSTMRTTITTALTAMPAATRNATWYACAFGRSSPSTRCMTPIAEITVLRMATPAAPPSCRPALNMVDARPVVAGVPVADAAACGGTDTLATDRRVESMRARISQRLALNGTVAISAKVVP